MARTADVLIVWLSSPGMLIAGSITSVQAVYVPADDYTDPAPFGCRSPGSPGLSPVTRSCNPCSSAISWPSSGLRADFEPAWGGWEADWRPGAIPGPARSSAAVPPGPLWRCITSFWGIHLTGVSRVAWGDSSASRWNEGSLGLEAGAARRTVAVPGPHRNRRVVPAAPVGALAPAERRGSFRGPPAPLLGGQLRLHGYPRHPL